MSDRATGTIASDEIYYFRERTRNRCYSAVVAAFAKLVDQEGLTKREIAARLGKEPAQITRWLSGPGNWTLDTISDLLLAMGAELNQSVSWLKDKTAHPVAHELTRPMPAANVVFLGDPNWQTSVPKTPVPPFLGTGYGSASVMGRIESGGKRHASRD